MRGHWESGTRKLNKHYQSGSAGVPSDPWVWMKYLTGGSPIPMKFTHDISDLNPYSEQVPYYNMIVNSVAPSSSGNRYGSTYSNADFAWAHSWIGPVSPRYDYVYKPGPTGTFSGDEEIWYDDQVSQHLRPDKNLEYGNFSVNIFRDTGKRFVKFHCPKYGYAPSFWYGSEGDNNNILKALAHPEIIPTDIRLSAKACKAFSWYTYHKQTIIIQKDNPGGNPTEITLMNYVSDQVENLYDFEQIGQSYYEKTVQNVRWEYWPAVYRDVTFRIYCFIYNGEFYVDLMVHCFDPVTGEELTPERPFYVYNMSYPSALMGFCYAPAYVQPNEGFADYPSFSCIKNLPTEYLYDVNALSDGTLEDMLTIDTESVLPIGGVYGTDYTLKFCFNQMDMIIMDVAESNFWMSEASWHTEHGGTPYLTI